MRAFAVGDELFRAVQYPFAIDEFGDGLEIVRFRTGLRFGETETTDFFALSEIAQIPSEMVACGTAAVIELAPQRSSCRGQSYPQTNPVQLIFRGHVHKRVSLDEPPGKS